MDVARELGLVTAPLRQRVSALETAPRLRFPPGAFFDHFYGDGTLRSDWAVAFGGASPTLTMPLAETPTIVRLSSGASASSSVTLNWGNRYPFIGAAALMRAGARFRLTTAKDANSQGYLGLLTTGIATGYAILGHAGGSSSTNWVAITNDGATSTTTVLSAMDTAFHEFEIWFLAAARCWFLIDGAVVAEHTTNNPTGALNPRFLVQNGATAADRRVDADWIYAFENAA